MIYILWWCSALSLLYYCHSSQPGWYWGLRHGAACCCCCCCGSQTDNTGPTLSLSLSLRWWRSDHLPRLRPDDLGQLSPVLVTPSCWSASQPHGLSETERAPVCLSESGLVRQAGGGDRQRLRKCQINCKMMTCWALPCLPWLPVTVGCFRLRLQDVRRSDIVTLSSRGQWSPWEQEADIFSHLTISDVKQ